MSYCLIMSYYYYVLCLKKGFRGNFWKKIRNIYNFEGGNLGFKKILVTILFNEAVAMETACEIGMSGLLFLVHWFI